MPKKKRSIVQRSPDKRLTAINALLGGLGQTLWAVQLQRTRLAYDPESEVDDDGKPFAVDADLMVYAIHAVMQHIDALRDFGVDVSSPESEFEASFKDAKHLRNILAHSDEYLTGEGLLQRDFFPELPYKRTAQLGANKYVIQIFNPDVEVDVLTLANAVETLAEAAFRAGVAEAKRLSSSGAQRVPMTITDRGLVVGGLLTREPMGPQPSSSESERTEPVPTDDD